MASDTLVIIPAYNEEKAIAPVIQLIRKRYPELDVVVVDDGSSDGTVPAARQAGAKVISHPHNMGYGVAIQTGYKYAVERGYDHLVQVDGDGQHDVFDIEKLLRKVKDGTCDIVIGSRFHGDSTYKPPLIRGIGIRFFRLFLRLLSGAHFSDPTSGFQAMNRSVLRVFVKDLFPCDYPDADMVLLLQKLHFRIREVPVNMFLNAEGKSMHAGPFRGIYYVFKMILSMLLTLMRRY